MRINFHYLGCSCDVVQSSDSLIDLGWSLIKMPLGWVTIWLGNGPFTRVSDPPINHLFWPSHELPPIHEWHMPVANGTLFVTGITNS